MLFTVPVTPMFLATFPPIRGHWLIGNLLALSEHEPCAYRCISTARRSFKPM